MGNRRIQLESNSKGNFEDSIEKNIRQKLEATPNLTVLIQTGFLIDFCY
jgi:hypothetical protein